MMSRLLMLLSAATVCVASHVVCGQESKAPAQKSTAASGARKPAESFAEGSARVYIEGIEKYVSLTERQKQEMAEIIKARIKAANDINLAGGGKRGAALLALYNARKIKDNDAIQKAEAACDAAFAPDRDAYRKAEDKLDGVLTPEQRQKVMAARAMECTDDLVVGVQLSEKQKKKVKTACDDVGAGGFDAIERRLPRAIAAILTSEQLKDIFRYRAMGDIGGISREFKLTEEQRKLAGTVVDELAAAPNLEKDWPTFAALRTQLERRIEDKLSPDQKKRLTVSASYSTNFRRPSWRWCLGGPTIDAKGTVERKPY